MAVPKKRHSKSRKRIKKANWKISTPTLRACPNCGELGIPYQICKSCGFYKNKQVLIIKSKKEKKGT
ncbi:MAG: 50S ribosomal protein L32 [bacterium]